MSWSYDSFGNRLTQTDNGGMNIWTQSGNDANGNPHNQVTGTNARGVSWTPDYDAAGNMLDDGANQYLYDADGHVCAVRNLTYGGMTGYLYNASGQRVAKGTITSLSCDTTANGFTLTNQYILGPNGEQMTEMAVSGGTSTWLHTNAYAGGVIATYLNDGVSPHFRFADWLGTTRAQTNNAGTLELTCQSLPFGDTSTQCTPATEQFYTGYERDTESGNDYAQARYYASSMGRFLSPDPSGLAFADPSDPQSLNLYEYVMNNPLTLVDPTGLHWKCTPDTWNDTTNTKTAGACHWVDDGNTFQGLLLMDMVTDRNAQQLQQGQGQSNTASNTAAKPANTPRPGIIHSLYCSAESDLLAAAHISNSTVGFGAGGSAGAGLLFGYGVSAGVQEVADSHGNLGVAFNVGFSPGIGVLGLGAIIGGQASISTAKTIQGLSGTSTNFGGSAGGGLAGGFDVSKGENGTTTGNVTVGAGVGTKGAAMAIQHTWVPSSLSTNCGGG